MEKYLESTKEQGIQFSQELKAGSEFYMLNLLRYNETAKYDENKRSSTVESTSGREAYNTYMSKIQAGLEYIGSEVVFRGNCLDFLIGPQEEKWDETILVRYESLAKFMEFSKSINYKENVHHRKAALKDSRLMPITNKTKEDSQKLGCKIIPWQTPDFNKEL